MNSANIHNFMQESAASAYSVIEKAKLSNIGAKEEKFPLLPVQRNKIQI